MFSQGARAEVVVRKNSSPARQRPSQIKGLPLLDQCEHKPALHRYGSPSCVLRSSCFQWNGLTMEAPSG